MSAPEEWTYWPTPSDRRSTSFGPGFHKVPTRATWALLGVLGVTNVRIDMTASGHYVVRIKLGPGDTLWLAPTGSNPSDDIDGLMAQIWYKVLQRW